MTGYEPTNLAQSLGGLKPKDKAPASARVLNAWITQAQDHLGSAGPRLGWLVAATVVSASLQRAVDEFGAPLFLLKGGTMLQYRLPGMSRTTQDIDGLRSKTSSRPAPAKPTPPMERRAPGLRA